MANRKGDKKMKRLSDFGQKRWDVEQIDMSQLLGKEITIMDVHWLTGEKGEYASLLIDVDGESRFANTGAMVVVELLKRAQKDGELPVRAKFVEKTSANKRTYLMVE